MKLLRLLTGAIRENCYIIYREETKEALIIDPGDDADLIEEALRKEDLKAQAILITHGHFDHIMAAGTLQQDLKIPVIIGEDDAEMLEDPEKNMAGMNIGRGSRLTADRTVKDGEILDLVFRITVLKTPGHTDGSVCYYLKDEGILFSGDTLFYRSVGRTWKPGDHEILIQSIRDKLTGLPDETAVCSGHGGLTTIGDEKRLNPFL